MFFEEVAETKALTLFDLRDSMDNKLEKNYPPFQSADKISFPSDIHQNGQHPGMHLIA